MVGFFICIGHSFLDIVLVLSLIFGTGPFISNTTIVVLIGLVGGGILVFFGITLLKDLKSEKIDFNFLNAVDTESENLIKSEKSDHKSNKIQNLSKPPIIRGVLISMSNPYWWLWCAVIGLNLMTQFSVTL
ncbi:MAG: LysE family transporter, partial [Candidatus Hermodarchaeota archaeon]